MSEQCGSCGAGVATRFHRVCMGDARLMCVLKRWLAARLSVGGYIAWSSRGVEDRCYVTFRRECCARLWDAHLAVRMDAQCPNLRTHTV